MAKSRVILLIITAVCSVFGLSNAAASDYYENTNNAYVISENSTCSSLPTELKGLECHPLSFYVKNVSKYFTNNTKMLFTAGIHDLPLPPGAQSPVVNVTGISNFSMIGIGAVNYSQIPSDEGSPLPSSAILCSTPKYINQPRNGILFYKTSTIHIENLIIEGCGAKFAVHSPDNFTLVSALTFRESYDVNLTQIRIEESLGFGLDADRIFGSFRVRRSAFVRCKAYIYKHQSNKHIGGNARFWYSKYNPSVIGSTTPKNVLYIHQSWFMHGHLNGKKDHGGFNFASGLIVRIFIPSVHVTINNITVNNNTGSHGGNMAILITDYHENTSTIAITDSIIANGSAIRGGGMQFWVHVNRNHNFYKLESYNLTEHYIMNISRVRFVNNSAEESGGGIYIGHYQSKTIDYIVRHINFTDCTFSKNLVRYKKGRTTSYTGAAVEVIRHNIDDFVPHTVPQYSIDFNRCNFNNNILKEVPNEGGIVDFVSTQSVIITDCNFTFNEGTAISLKQSNIKFYGHTTFKGNRGRHGGALKFCELSKMYLPNNDVKIDFIENNASELGGAIYTSQQLCLETAPACFFQPIRNKNSPVEDLKITLRFRNNTARKAGDAIYGGQVDHCYLYYSSNDNDTTYLSKRVFQKVFNLKEQRNSTSLVSSPPYGACFYNNSMDELHCESKCYPSVVYPGQTITLQLAAVGQRNGISPVLYNLFNLTHVGKGCCSELEMKTHNTSTDYNERLQYASLEYTIYSNQSVANFSLSVQQASLTEVRYVHYKTHRLTIKLGKCPWGFILSNDRPYRCLCDQVLIKYRLQCDIDTQHITRLEYYWLGCANQISDTKSETKCQGVILAKRCYDSYCNTTKINITSSTLDSPCTEGREGILCGRCKANYSLALGTQRCLPSCPVYMVYIIVLTCAAGGIILILFLIACNFTVSEGTINGLLFYAHVVHQNAYVFFPGINGVGTSNNIFRLFIAWLNLDIGFEFAFTDP